MEYEDSSYYDSNDSTFNYPTPPQTDKADVPSVIYMIIGVLAAVENAIVLLIVVKSKEIRKKRNIIFLFSLSLADFIAGILSFLIYFDYFHDSLIFGSLLGAMFLISMFSLSAVCIERYIAIVGAPFTYKEVVTLKRCVIVCVLYWILIICLVEGLHMIAYNKWTRFSINCLSILTIVANYILYFKMSKALMDNDRNVTEKLGQNVVGRSRKLIRSFSILLVLASVCWLPVCVFLTIALFDKQVDENITALYSLYCLALSNSVINPFIYWYRLPGIKEGLYSLVCCWKNVASEKRDDISHVPTISTSVVELSIT